MNSETSLSLCIPELKKKPKNPTKNPPEIIMCGFQAIRVIRHWNSSERRTERSEGLVPGEVWVCWWLMCTTQSCTLIQGFTPGCPQLIGALWAPGAHWSHSLCCAPKLSILYHFLMDLLSLQYKINAESMSYKHALSSSLLFYYL